jgi:hypothetical protein
MDAEEITDSYFYDDGSYDGVLFKTTAPTTQRVLATISIQEEKEATRVIQGTEAELEAKDTHVETDSEGYTGTLIATGEVEKYIIGVSGTPYVEQKQVTTAAPMIYSIETTNSNQTQVATQFPALKYFQETRITQGETVDTGFAGDLSKYSTPVRTSIGNIVANDVKPATQNRTFSKTVDVTNSILDKTYRFISGQGTTATNSTSYPTTYQYKDTTKEGLLNYVSKGSTLVNTVVDTQSVTVSPQFSTSPPATYNYNSGGYTGTLNATNTATVVSGSYSAAASKFVTGQSSSYYDDGVYSGSLSSYVSGQTWNPATSFYATDSRSQSGYCATDPNCGPSNIPSSVSYNSGGYSGTLSQTSYDYSQSQIGVPFSYSRYATYGGTVTKPGFYSDNYSYQGTVNKPASDTRVWTRTYTGNVSKTTNTYDYYADYSGKIFDIINRVPSAAPATITYTDPSGYTGTLDKDVPSETSKIAALTTSQVTTNITGYKLYTPGEFASVANTQLYPAIYTYDRGDGYKGNINYTGTRATEFAYSQREGHRTQTQTTTSSVNSFVNTIAYNSGGFDGTLNKNGTSYVTSGTFVADQSRTEVDSRTSTTNTFPASLAYSNTGFTGTLAKNGISTVISGTYLPTHTKTQAMPVSMSDLACTDDCVAVFGPTRSYNSGGYVGTLNDSGTFTFTPSGSTNTDYTREFVLRTFDPLEKPTSRPTYSGSWSKVATYEMDRIHVYNESSGSYSYGTYYNGNTTNAIWESVGGLTSHGNNWTWDDYYNNRGGDGTFKVDANFWRKSYYITEWKWTRNIGTITQVYNGDVTRPESDTRNWQQNYSGTVTKPGSDTRVYGQDYSGTVSKVVDYYKHYGTYSGTLKKDLYSAQIDYNADYKGDINKVTSIPNYRYDQKYIGTLEKSTTEFQYGFERTYEGLIFKNVTEQDIEYTQEYAGEVTKK